jgi:CBS domain-containing protein
MSRNAQVVSPGESLQRAAQLMGELDVGALPVCDGERLVGMVTDRDITVRGMASGKMPQDAHVDEVMTADMRWCYEDQPLDDVMIQMADSQVRRVPVVSHDDRRRVVGIVSLADVAVKTEPGRARQDVEDVVEVVSRPAAAGGGAAMPPNAAAGRTGGGNSVGSPAGVAGTDLPAGGGQHDMGVAGAAGQGPGGDAQRTGATADPRTSSGVSGVDITRDRVPPPGLPPED